MMSSFGQRSNRSHSPSKLQTLQRAFETSCCLAAIVIEHSSTRTCYCCYCWVQKRLYLSVLEWGQIHRWCSQQRQQPLVHPKPPRSCSAIHRHRHDPWPRSLSVPNRLRRRLSILHHLPYRRDFVNLILLRLASSSSSASPLVDDPITASFWVPRLDPRRWPSRASRLVQKDFPGTQCSRCLSHSQKSHRRGQRHALHSDSSRQDHPCSPASMVPCLASTFVARPEFGTF